MPFAENGHGAKLGPPNTFAQPGPSPGTGNGPTAGGPAAPVVVACTAKALACKIASGRFHFKLKNRSEEHTSELQSLAYLVCRLLLEKKKNKLNRMRNITHSCNT